MALKTKKELIDFERRMQEQMNAFYKSKGFTIDRSQANTEFDVILDYGANDQKRDSYVEEKFRHFNRLENVYDDQLIEIVQDIKTGNLGWYYTTRADSIFYIICVANKPRYMYKLNLLEFKNWFISWLENQGYVRCAISTKGWGITLNIIVPNKEIIPGLDLKRIEINPINEN